ncbi:ribose utilization transcriptional repressor RbsR [Ligilactobacillus agilis]|uniref:ribose utilization transcriptional repressor RbsR n=1 Tax=Ligilactobacillus agilis TaxID=1601 RepID=UPI00155844AA|nr:LacI family DNA-binding transcriptional regulator [Ligilactobacillus agilis]
MKGKVRIIDVAQKAGVSVTTVSQILNGKGERFSQATQDKVRKIRDELGYVPDFNARNLIMGSAKTIGIIIPNITNPFFATFVRGVEVAAQRGDFIPLVLSGNGNPDLERQYVEQLIQRTVDGLIIASPAVNKDTIDHFLKANGVPYLLIDQNPLDDGDRVSTDDYLGAKLAVEHLIELGHKRIAMLYCDKPSVNQAQRLQGYKDQLQSAGLESTDDLIVTGPLSKLGGYQASEQVLQTKASAVFAVNDEMAIGLYRGLNERGLEVPADLSIVGYDNIDLSEYVNPPLTTIAQPVFEMGQVAFRTLLQRIEQPDAPAQKIKLPVELVVRESSRKV